MTNRAKPPLSYVREILEYDPETGIILRKDGIRPRKDWPEAGGPHPSGYRFIQIDGRKYGAHRLAWLFLSGDWAPKGFVVDHINRCGDDNRAINLRLATPGQNQINRSARNRDKSIPKGVTKKRAGGWEARIGFNGKSKYLGYFANMTDAADAYKAAANRLYGEYACDEAPIPKRRLVKTVKAPARLGLPTFTAVDQRLSYDPETGVVTWKVCGHSGMNGKPAGFLNADGYVIINTLGHVMRAHRLAWLLTYRAFPPPGLVIDHVNGDRSDNRLANLRLATKLQNNLNLPVHADSSSGVKGASWVASRQRWHARIRICGKTRSLGYFIYLEDAGAAYAAAALTHHGEFARYGRTDGRHKGDN